MSGLGSIRNELRNHSFLREVVSWVLVLGIIYFGVKGTLVLSLQTTSPLMGVEGTSMIHEGDSWRDYYLEENYDPSSFPFRGGLQEGDLVIVRGVDSLRDIEVGDVIIWKKGNEPAVIHRVAKVDLEEGYVRTKGDHRPSVDYPKVRLEDIIGVAVYSIPYLGYPSQI